MNNEKLFLSVALGDIETSAVEQIEDIISLPEVIKMAIMPDVHSGYDMPIGGVCLLNSSISPSFVGVDIGCGMLHYNTKMNYEEFFSKYSPEEVYEIMKRYIPVGFSMHEKPQEYDNFESFYKELNDNVDKTYLHQLGTLGGGNHFFEIGKNKNNEIGITIHSGSRGLGHKVATYYTTNFPRILPYDSEEGKSYYDDMFFCIEYAKNNRILMLKNLMNNMSLEVNSENIIHCVHNTAEVFQDNIFIHRKGATSAKNGEKIIIPANMSDGVFIAQGLGNEDFLYSASHGCGRKMSRSKAKKEISVEEFKEKMGNIISKIDENTLDESPMAYKSSKYVMSNQEGKNLIVLDKFEPIIVLKG